MNACPTLLLGVDAGGTSTRARLATRHHDSQIQVIGNGTSGGGNIRALGFERATDNMRVAIEAAFRDADLPATPVGAACFAIAGAGRPQEQTAITEWIETRRIATSFTAATDAEIVLAAAETRLHPAAESPPGVVLIAGTGSLAWGRDAYGRQARCGGWGYLLGDEGSAFWIGQQALNYATRASDQRNDYAGEDHQRFTASIVNAASLKTATELIGWVYSAAQPRQQIASLAAAVFDAARQNPIALGILRTGARELAAHIHTVATKLELADRDFVLACTGGVLLKQPSYRKLLNEALAALEIAPSQTHFIDDPVEGAIELARRLVVQ